MRIGLVYELAKEEGGHTVNTVVVVISPYESEFVLVSTMQTELAVRDFDSYFYGGFISGYWDETNQALYQGMVKSVEQYGGLIREDLKQAVAALHDPLSENDHRPNITFRVTLFIK